MSRRIASRLAWLLGFLVLTGACESPLGPEIPARRFHTQEEAGSGHIAVLSVARWDEHVRDYLQPTFDLTPTQALEEIAPTTAAMEYKLLDMLKVVVRAATPSTSTTETETETTERAVGDAEPETSSSREVTRSREPGEAPEFTPTLPGDRSAADLPGRQDVLDTELGMDPMLRHTLAAALYQEVQLLNHYVRDAAVREGYTPYVVRMQVSLMPRARAAPYDAYASVSFFPGHDRGKDAKPTGSSVPVRPLRPAARQDLLRAASRAGATGGTPQAQEDALLNPVVIPLLVTDSLETMLASRTSNVVRQYALALSALIQGFSMRADVERYTDELIATAGHDANSLYTVSRLTDNTIRVRLGAMLHSSGQHFMVPQTRNLTLLLLVPPGIEPGRAVSVVGRTEFVDVQTGQALPPRTPGALRGRLLETARASGALAPIRDADRHLELLDAVSANDYAQFVVLYDRAVCGAYSEGQIQQAWVTLTSLHVGGQYTSTAFSLPKETPAPSLPPVDGHLLALDDGRFLVLQIDGIPNLEHRRMHATLGLMLGGTRGRHTLTALDVRVAPDAGSVTLYFPSLQLLRMGGQSVFSMAAAETGHELTLQATGTQPSDSNRYKVGLAALAKEPVDTSPGVAIAALDHLNAQDGKVELDLALTLAEAAPAGGRRVRVAFSFRNAEGNPVAGVAARQRIGTEPVEDVFLNHFEVEVPATQKTLRARIWLEQLVNATTLTITATPEEGGGAGTHAVAIVVPADPAGN